MWLVSLCLRIIDEWFRVMQLCQRNTTNLGVFIFIAQTWSFHLEIHRGQIHYVIDYICPSAYSHNIIYS